MDKELLELEAELRHFRPRAPSPRLLAALEQNLATAMPGVDRRYRTAACWTSWKCANWAAAAAFAMLVAMASNFWPGGVGPAAREPAPSLGPSTSGVAAYKPVTAVRTVYGADNGEFVTFADGSIGRRVRSQCVDTITWRNPATNASVRWSVPREEERIVLVSAY